MLGILCVLVALRLGVEIDFFQETHNLIPLKKGQDEGHIDELETLNVLELC